MRYPFTLVKVKSKSGTIWHARFWDEETQKYSNSSSTGIPVEGKKERRREAEEAAKLLIHKIEEAKNAPKNLKAPQGSSIQKEKSVAETPLAEYLESFWKEDSQYANYKRNVEKKPLSLQYIENNHEDIRRHVVPFQAFNCLTVGTLSKPILREWLIWLASRKASYRKHDGTLIEKSENISSRKANAVIQAVRVAVRWAFENERIPTDPFYKLGEIPDTPKEKGILTFEERRQLTTSPITNCRSRLVMLLGSYCGLRRGEMRGLKWGDIGYGLLEVQHNFVNKEKMKNPKWNSFRKVPITELVQEFVDIAFSNAKNKLPESYIFESPVRPGNPVSNNFFRDSVKNELAQLGINASQQKARNLTPHSLRHTFVTLSQLSGIPDAEVMALAGQKRESTFRRYSHVPQVLNFDEARRKIANEQATELKAANG